MRDRHTGVVGHVLSALGPKALFVWVLTLALVLSMTAGLLEAVTNLEAMLAVVVAILGASLGWILALLPVKGWLAALLSLVFGVEYLLVRVGRLEQRLLAIAREALRLLWQLVEWYLTEVPPDWGPLPSLYLALWSDMGTLLTRTYSWISNLVTRSAAVDVVGPSMVWGFVVWMLTAWAGFVIRRHHRPLVGVLPGGLLLSFVLSYTGSSPYIFLPILGTTLVLMAMMGQHAREESWMQHGVDFSQGLWSDVVMTATGVSVALVLAAAVAPSITVDRIADWVAEITARQEETTTEVVAEGLGLQQRPEPRPVRQVQAAVSTDLPQRHLIGSGPELSRMVVMVIETGEIPPVTVPDPWVFDSAPRHYWRSHTYDYYFGRGWATSNTEVIDYEPGEQLSLPEGEHLRPLRQSVHLIGDQTGGLVFVDGQLVSVDQEFAVATRRPDEFFGATTESRRYRADSVITVASVDELRAASEDYPPQIVSRYLQLPDTVPARVVSLARDLTALQPTPFDRAYTIEQYLREFPYNLDVPVPGLAADIADYFLFDLQEGYCDYYATSMVVMARAVGLPARMVVGYASGSYDPFEARYVVTRADAHAWVEIYFPGYGWVEFEPTGGRPAIDRPGQPQELTWPESTEPAAPLVERSGGDGQWHPVTGTWILMGLGAVALVVGVGTGADSARLLLVRPESMAKRLHQRLTAYARRLRAPIRDGDTPHELAAALKGRVVRIGRARGFAGSEIVEPAADEIQSLTDLYIDALYRPEPDLSSVRLRGAAWTWWRLRWRLWLAWLWRRSGTT
jgi:transglutaminase-like putative cysteine protease